MNLNTFPNPQHSYPPPPEPFLLDTTSRAKPANEKETASGDRELLKMMDKFDEFIKRSQGSNKLEEYDEFVKAGKIVDATALKLQMEALQGQNDNAKKAPSKKKKEESAFVWNQGPAPPKSQRRHRPKYSTLYPYYPNPQPIYHTTAGPAYPRPNYPPPFPNPQPIHQNYPRPTYNQRPSTPIPNHQSQNNPLPSRVQNARHLRNFTNLGRPIDQLYRQLRAVGKIGTMPPKLYRNGPPSGFDPQSFCAYHSNAPGHSTVDCWALKHKIQDMIEAGNIVLKRGREQGPNVNKKPLSEQ